VLTAYFVHCFGMEDAAELRHSNSDEVFHVDDEMTGDQGAKESAAMIKKQCNSLPVLKQTGKNGKVLYPFLEIPKDRDIMMFMILIVTKPCAMAKGKGIVKVWQAAVDEITR
jgi:hypothetical protein